MRRIAGCGAFALAAATAWAGPTEAQILKNGDFENGVAEWNVVDMSGQCRFEADAAVKQVGKKSLRVEKSAPGKNDFLKQSVDLPAGVKDVRATCWCKVDSGRAEVTVYFFDAKGDTVGKGYVALVSSGTTKKFEKCEEKLKVPKNATGVGVNVIAGGKGTFWIDGFEIACTTGAAGPGTAATAGAPAFVNAGFESGLEGWKPLAFGSGTAEAKLDAMVRAEGKASARIDRASQRLLPQDGLFAEVTAGADLGRQRLRFQARVDADASASAALQAFDENGCCVATARWPFAGEPGKFAPGAVVLDVPSGARRLVVSLIVVGSGTVWFDDLSLSAEK